MFNYHLANGEINEKMQRRMQEAETYRLHKQLGLSNSRIAKWVFILIFVIIAVAVVVS